MAENKADKSISIGYVSTILFDTPLLSVTRRPQALLNFQIGKKSIGRGGSYWECNNESWNVFNYLRHYVLLKRMEFFVAFYIYI